MFVFETVADDGFSAVLRASGIDVIIDWRRSQLACCRPVKLSE